MPPSAEAGERIVKINAGIASAIKSHFHMLCSLLLGIPSQGPPKHTVRDTRNGKDSRSGGTVPRILFAAAGSKVLKG